MANLQQTPIIIITEPRTIREKFLTKGNSVQADIIMADATERAFTFSNNCKVPLSQASLY
jgi:hypothetical protein